MPVMLETTITSQKEFDTFFKKNDNVVEKDRLIIIKSYETIRLKDRLVVMDSGTLQILSRIEIENKNSYIAINGGTLDVNSNSRLRINCENKSTIALRNCEYITILISAEKLIYITAADIKKLNIKTGSTRKSLVNIYCTRVNDLKLSALHNDEIKVNLSHSNANIISLNSSKIKIEAKSFSKVNSFLKNYSTQEFEIYSDVICSTHAFDISTIFLRNLCKNIKISLFDNSRIIGNIRSLLDSAENAFDKVLDIPANIIYKSKNAQIIEISGFEKSTFLEKHGLYNKIVSNKIKLYKRVSKRFQTQENTINETIWTVGQYIKHPNWNPYDSECGAGKFHACAFPFMCDLYRQEEGDRYIAIEVNITDLHDWPFEKNHPNKIAFRAGTVLYECDMMGNKIENVESEVAV